MNTDNFMDTLKPLTLALVLAFGAGTITAMAEDVEQSGTNRAANNPIADDNTPYVTPIDTIVNTDWMSPVAAEFVKLDKTGNGLLLPYEASKDKAFNKRTFAQADSNKDGYIDQIEFIHFKTGKLPDEQATNNGAAHADIVLNNQEYVVQEPGTSAASQEPGSTIGELVNDSVITAKAKATILNTEQLKTVQISVETHDGEVILSGFVDSLAAKTRAEQVVSQIAGVKSVKNSLVVRS